MATSRLSTILSRDKHPSRRKPGVAYRHLVDVVLAYDGTDCLFWPYATTEGYGHLRSLGQDYLVHRLACEHINGEPPSPSHEAAHNCGKGHLGCVARRHLSWKTRAANVADKVPHGTHSRGHRQWNNKLTASDVSAIRAIKGTLCQREIAALYGVKQTTISAIFRGDSWAWLP